MTDPLLRLRPHTSDLGVLREVWLDRRYDVPCPIEPQLILDCGAHIGLTSRRLGDQHPEAYVMSVEPHPVNVDLCRQNNPSASVIWGAISGESGEASLRMPHGESAYNACSIARDKGPTLIEVPVFTIDELLGGRRADIVKLDIEGAEKSVFEGRCEWLNHVALLLVEHHDRFVPGCQAALMKAVAATGRPFYRKNIGGPNVAITFEDR